MDTGNTEKNDIDAIRQLAAKWRASWLAGDAESLISLFADEPVLMPQGQPAVFGKEKIRSLYVSVMKDFNFESKDTFVEAEVSGNLAYFWSTYTLTATPKSGGESFSDSGKSIFILKRNDEGQWRIIRLIDNSDREPADGQ